MSLNLQAPETAAALSPRITVIGVGGAGGNAVNNMIQSNLEGVEFLVMNTDSQALAGSLCDRRLQLGRNITQGLGAGSRPDIGRAAAEEAMDDILTQMESAHMVFVAAGMGGGTGTGGAPVIARAAREQGILTVGVVTKPFHFEGVHRMRLAENGITELQQYVDTLIIIPNQNLFRVANEKTTFADAFKMADDVLYSGVRGVTDLMVMPGLINLDFADIRSVMTEMGKAMMGTGEAEGENRSVASAEAAISNPLLDEVSMKGARGVLINITGGPDLTLFEVDEAANRIRDEVDSDANIIFGSTFDPQLEGRMRVSVVATGIDVDEAISPKPVTLSLVSDREQGQAKRLAETTATAEAGPAVTAELEDVIEAEVEFEADYQEEEGAVLFDDEPMPSPVIAPRGRGSAAQALAVEPEPETEADLEARATAGERYIAPPPVAAEPRPVRPSRPAKPAEPFAEAAMANATRESHQEIEAEAAPQAGRRTRSFLARMSDAARRIQAGEARTEPAPAQPVQREPALSRPAPAPRPAVSQPAVSQPVASQPVIRQPAAAQPAMAPRPQQPAPQVTPRPTASQPPSQTPVRSEPRLNRPAPTQPEPAPAPEQPQLTGLDPAQGDAGGEDDMLDIPAFLRRQAN